MHTVVREEVVLYGEIGACCVCGALSAPNPPPDLFQVKYSRLASTVGCVVIVSEVNVTLIGKPAEGSQESSRRDLVTNSYWLDIVSQVAGYSR